MLAYYYGLTNLGSGKIRDQWTYNASGALGDFNSNGTDNVTVRTLTGATGDFSLFLTFKKLQSGTNKQGSVLLSTVSGANGFDLLIDANNFLTLRTAAESHTFDKILLGGKNTIALLKAAQSFTILLYDVPNSAIAASQTHAVSPFINVAGGTFRVGGRDSLSQADPLPGVKNFYGEVDQLFLVSEKLSLVDSNTIFSGFLGNTVTQTTVSAWTKISDEWSTPDVAFGLYLAQDFAVFQQFIFDSGFELAAPSEYTGVITFVKNGGLWTTEHSYGVGGEGICQIGDSILIGDSALAFIAGLPSNFLIRINFSVGSKEIFFTYNLSEAVPGLRYNTLWRYGTVQTPVITLNPAYRAGFEMQGVLAPGAKMILFGTFTNSTASQVGLEAVFNIPQGLFYDAGINQSYPLYLNGLKVNSYTVTNGFIDIPGHVEISSDQIVFDKTNSLSLAGLKIGSFATDEFYRGTSFLASSKYAGQPLYRLKKENYFETHPFHLYHGRAWQETSAQVILNNPDEFWT